MLLSTTITFVIRFYTILLCDFSAPLCFLKKVSKRVAYSALCIFANENLDCLKLAIHDDLLLFRRHPNLVSKLAGEIEFN